jgi:hypothetical protein
MNRLMIGVLILTSMWEVSAQAASYYVDNTGGSDSNNGTAEATPWKTLTKVNNTAFLPGDVIHFKRGSTWTGTTLVIDSNGVSGNPVTYQAYGSGPAPIIQRSATPPTSGYTWAINVTGDYNIVKDLMVRHGHEAGIFLSSGASQNTIQGNEITASGTGVMVSGQFNLLTENYVHDLRMIVNTSGGDDDYGAVCFWIQAPNNEVSYNRGVNCKASSFDYGNDGGFVEVWSQGDNTFIHHNWAEGTNGFFELGSSGSGSARNVTVAYNVLYNTRSTLCTQVGGNFNIAISNFRFEHNTVYQPSGGTAFICSGSGYGFLTARNNIFSGGSMGGTPGTHTHNRYASNPPYSLGTGETVGNPLFVNPGAKDFHLQVGSPAIDGGVDLGYDEDYDGTPIPQGNAPDMGAFESGGSGPPPPPPPAVTSINDTSFTYSGNWSYATGPGKYLNDDHYTTTTNALYTYTFTGTRAQIFVATAPWHGRAAVSVDGGAETVVDLYSPTKVNQVPIYTTPTLPVGTHTVKVRCTGTRNSSSTGNYITGDRIDVTP